MQRFCPWLLVIGLALSAAAQAPAKKSHTPARKKPAAAAADPALPSRETVESFMHEMFGYNPEAKWQIVSIEPSEELPGFGEVLVAVGGGAAKLYITPDGKHAIQGEIMPFGARPFAETRAKLSAATGPSKGPANAPVTIVEFSDLECPHCAKAQPILEQLLADEPNARVVYQPFPLPQHKWAAKAAAYALCVNRESTDAFEKFVDSVYQNQLVIDETNADAKLTELAAAAGATGARAATCSSAPDIQNQVTRSVNLGREVGVNGTPTFFVNGRKVLDIVDTPYEQVKAVVDFAVSEAEAKK